MALSLRLVAWGLRLAPLISSLLEAWSSVSIGPGPCFMELVDFSVWRLDLHKRTSQKEGPDISVSGM